MSGRYFTPRRLQTLAMALIGALLGFAIASAWNRSGAPTPDQGPSVAAPAAGR